MLKKILTCIAILAIIFSVMNSLQLKAESVVSACIYVCAVWCYEYNCQHLFMYCIDQCFEFAAAEANG